MAQALESGQTDISSLCTLPASLHSLLCHPCFQSVLPLAQLFCCFPSSSSAPGYRQR
ncbi:hypothetical protein SKAU_G00396530 [Synaphobranchus kaupii]|uniref:Uncharacterized protein n=1 Tax=Synaphobranchus kaupii TaxID=118154 RepID=A0A9Q1ECK5_SYNKA|nr:hypothetical protein SKAU_G00396530 [Synaphobranchus kaupii]